MFENQQFAKHNSTATPKLSGNINGKPFHNITDADPDMGARLEVYAAGSYMWLPFQHISSVRIEEPKRLRDMLWIPAFVTTGASFRGAELGEVLIPVIYPLSYKHPDESVWLGRSTAWGEDDEGTEYPSGQRMLIADGEEIPLLEIRSLEFETGQAAVN